METATGTTAQPLAPVERTGAARTIPALWRTATAEARTVPAYLVETDDGWHEVSWQEAARRVDELANGLLALGIRKGDAVAIVARTRLEWVLVDYALALVGAIGAAVYPNSSSRETAYILDHSEAVAVFVEDEEQRAKVEATRADTPRVRTVISFGELDDLAARGREHAAANPAALADATAAVDEEDLFTYIYTSGTTGPPKACMIRHRNYYEMAATVRLVDDFVISGDVMLLYLPLAHNFGRLMHLLGAYLGYTVAFLPDPLRTAEVLPHVRPTVLPSVPRVYEKVYAGIRAQFDEATGLKRRIIDWSLAIGYRVSRLRQQRRPVPAHLALRHRIADRLVYSKVREKLGGRFRMGISGAAPLAREIAEFLHALDILILEGYGLTECTTACSVNRPSSFRFGTVGPALPGFEVKPDPDGELLVRSETVFAGYFKDEEATSAVLLPDGWLRTGDVGEIDEDGFITITDRKKDIIVTAGGKNVAPQNVENALKRSKYVSQAVVVGDRRRYVTALITLDVGEVANWARGERIEGDLLQLSGDERVRALVQEAVDEVNADLSRFEQIKRFAILPRDFSADHDEITPTLKLRRRAIEQNFADEIEALYR
jgi:long-chain acyl-CoA synthetase